MKIQSPEGLFDDDQPQDEFFQQEEDEAAEMLAGKNYDAVVTATDWTVETLVSQLNKSNINLDPSFQRRDAWTAKRKNEFIESVFMGLPVPQLVLAENKDRKGSYIVLDGKQRLLTLRQFSAKPDDPQFEQLRLSGLVLRPELNGKSFTELQEDASVEEDVNFFENYTIRTVVLRHWPSEEYLNLVFLRLNSGSLSLSTQELRQVLSPGPFTKFANAFTSDSEIIISIFNSKGKPDFRMRDVELTIRYFGLVHLLPKYSGNLKQFLDDTCHDLNKKWKSSEPVLRQEAVELEQAIIATRDIFGANAFTKWNGQDFEKRFNRAVFDVMVYYFREDEVRKIAMERKAEVVDRFKQVCDENAIFRSSLETTTKSIGALGSRLQLWGDALSSVVGKLNFIPKYDSDNNRIII